MPTSIGILFYSETVCRLVDMFGSSVYTIQCILYSVQYWYCMEVVQRSVWGNGLCVEFSVGQRVMSRISGLSVQASVGQCVMCRVSGLSVQSSMGQWAICIGQWVKCIGQCRVEDQVYMPVQGYRLCVDISVGLMGYIGGRQCIDGSVGQSHICSVHYQRVDI